MLEQQQRDSQRKLATAKLAKQHKLEQRASLESKLSSLKFANGEQREQLNQARVVLSRSTRELGSAKLLSDRSRKALKDFSDRLSRAILSARSLQVLRRKLDSAVIEIGNMHSIVLRKKSEAIESLKDTEKRRDEAKHREQSLRQSIHAEKLKAQRLMEEILPTFARSIWSTRKIFPPHSRWPCPPSYVLRAFSPRLKPKTHAMPVKCTALRRTSRHRRRTRRSTRPPSLRH